MKNSGDRQRRKKYLWGCKFIIKSIQWLSNFYTKQEDVIDILS